MLYIIPMCWIQYFDCNDMLYYMLVYITVNVMKSISMSLQKLKENENENICTNNFNNIKRKSKSMIIRQKWMRNVLRALYAITSLK